MGCNSTSASAQLAGGFTPISDRIDIGLHFLTQEDWDLQTPNCDNKTTKQHNSNQHKILTIT